MKLSFSTATKVASTSLIIFGLSQSSFANPYGRTDSNDSQAMEVEEQVEDSEDMDGDSSEATSFSKSSSLHDVDLSQLSGLYLGLGVSAGNEVANVENSEGK